MSKKTEIGIKKLYEFDIGNFENKEEFFKFGLKEIEKHIPKLKELRDNKNPHFYNELADVCIWAKLLLISNNVDDKVVLKRIKRFIEHIEENKKRR